MAKALVSLRGKNNRYLIAASQNRGALKIFELKKNPEFVPLLPDDASGRINL